MHQVQDRDHGLDNCPGIEESEASSRDEPHPFPSRPQAEGSSKHSDEDNEMSPTHKADQSLGPALPIPFPVFEEINTSRSQSRPRRKSYDSIKEVPSSK
jgi:ribosome assembly protein YihI (activator of Der GTPase)